MLVLDMEVEAEVGLGGIAADLALELASVLPLVEVTRTSHRS